MNHSFQASLGTAPDVFQHPDIQVRSLSMEDTKLEIALGGRIRYDGAKQLQGYLLHQYLYHQPREILLDFGDVHYIDSQGLSLLITLYRNCESNGTLLFIKNAPAHMRSMLELTRLDALINMI